MNIILDIHLKIIYSMNIIFKYSFKDYLFNAYYSPIFI